MAHSDAADAVAQEILRVLELDVSDSATANVGGSMNAQMRAKTVLDLAEAHAWLTHSGQPHGGR